MKITRLVSFSVLLLVTMLACSAASNIVATPTPASTPMPDSTPTPLPSPTPNVVLFAESEFVDACNMDSTADVERFVENGQFNMRVSTPLYVAWTECTKAEYTDFVMEVDATQISGPDNNAYGVIFRYGIGADEFYAFLISGDGLYALTVDGASRAEAEFLVPWTDSSAIKQGTQTNHMKISAAGSTIKYYINDQLLGEAQDARFSTGTVGFFAGTMGDGGVQVSFDNLTVSQP